MLTRLRSSQRKLFATPQLFCQGQAKDLHEGTNHSNIDGSHMNVQCDLARVARFQSHLHSLKYLWFDLLIHT